MLTQGVPLSSAATGRRTAASICSEYSGYHARQKPSLTCSRAVRPPQWRRAWRSSTLVRLRAHWNSWVMQSEKEAGPSPCASASRVKTPRHPEEVSMREVVKSSASSGPRPPLSFSAAVRTA
jgi:hypothetical protein